jgi:hypothetical protein
MAPIKVLTTATRPTLSSLTTQPQLYRKEVYEWMKVVVEVILTIRQDWQKHLYLATLNPILKISVISMTQSLLLVARGSPVYQGIKLNR